MNKKSTPAPSGKFQDFISESAVLCQCDAADSRSMICSLVDLLVKNNPELDKDDVIREVFDREAVFPTVIAPGLAMPHARINGLDRLLVALGTSANGVKFGESADGAAVKVVVLVLSPADNPGLHLQVVSALAREFCELEKIDKLASLTRVSEVVGFFSEAPFKLPDYLKVADLTDTNVNVLLEQDTLAFAIRKFAETKCEQMAVLDDEGDLRGVLSLEDILKYSLPEHILWLDDLSPIYNFQPFADMLANANETKVADVMREEFVLVNVDVPAVQLAKLFLNEQDNELLVTDKEGKLHGLVRLRDFCAKLFWE